jgi:prepilin-type processing-associated H-X9-DG protein
MFILLSQNEREIVAAVRMEGMTMRTRLPLAVLLLTVLLAPAFAATAQPLADRLPNDTLVYFGWRGADAMGPGYSGSHLKAVLDASDFSQVINDFLPQIAQRIAQEDPEAAQVLPVMTAIARPMWKHPSALYFGGLDLGGQEPMPRLAMLCEAGPDAAQLLATLKDLVAKAQQQGPPVPIEVKEAKGVVAVTIGKMSPSFDPLLRGTGAGDSLATDQSFKDAMAQVGKEPSLAFYINAEGILATADQIINREGGPDLKTNWPKVRDTLGLAGLKRIIYTGGFDGKDWLDAVFVAAPAPRAGLLKLAESAPLAPDLLKIAPKTSTYVAAGRFNIAGLVAQMREGIGQFSPEARQQMDQGLQQVSQMLGMDVEKDLLGSLGDQWVCYTDPNTGGFGVAGSVIVNRLADPAKAEQSFSRLEQFINQAAAANLKNENIHISFQTQQAGGLTLHYLAVPLVTPTWAIKDGNLYVALYPQTVVAAADFGTRKGPSILDNDDFVAIRKRLGTETAASVQYSDLVRTTPINYGAWVAVSRLVGFGDIFGVRSPLMVMPPLQKLMAEVGPAGGISWTDDAGFHLRNLSPFPGAEALAMDPIGAYMTSAGPAVALGLLMPAVSKARGAAERVKSSSNLRQIGQGILLYANENNGKAPPDLGTILKDEDLGPEAFIAPQTGKTVPPNLRDMTKDQQAAWVRENSDYVYLGKGKRVFDMKPDEPVAHEKFEVGRGQGINILYGDGHVEWVKMPEAQRILGVDAARP